MSFVSENSIYTQLKWIAMQDCREGADIIELSFMAKLDYYPYGFKCIVKYKI